jgi:hypothetical protein
MALVTIILSLRVVAISRHFTLYWTDLVCAVLDDCVIDASAAWFSLHANITLQSSIVLEQEE